MVFVCFELFMAEDAYIVLTSDPNNTSEIYVGHIALLTFSVTQNDIVVSLGILTHIITHTYKISTTPP
jgi:hypothetical protein